MNQEGKDSHLSGPKVILVRPLFVSCLAAVVVFASCSKASTQPPSDQGFYRQTDGAAVYYVQPASKTVCMVANPSMMDAYGGFKSVHVVGRDVDIQAAGKMTGTCRWPPGYYRKPDTDVVYRVRETDVCRVRARGKIPAVVVSADSNVLIALSFAGDCK